MRSSTNGNQLIAVPTCACKFPLEKQFEQVRAIHRWINYIHRMWINFSAKFRDDPLSNQFADYWAGYFVCVAGQLGINTFANVKRAVFDVSKFAFYDVIVINSKILRGFCACYSKTKQKQYFFCNPSLKTPAV